MKSTGYFFNGNIFITINKPIIFGAWHCWPVL